MAQGKGISEAVRNTVLEWLDDDTTQSIVKQARTKVNKTGGSSNSGLVSNWQLLDEKAWVRKARRSGPTGFTRTYRCNGLPSNAEVELEVRSNSNDTRINYYAFKVDGKFVAGGQADVASVNVSSNRPNVAKVGAATAEASASTSSSGIQTKIGSFRRLSESELDKLNVEAQHGDDTLFDHLFEERE